MKPTTQEEIRFEDYEKMLWKLAHNQYRYFGGRVELEDLFSIACLEYVRTRGVWDKNPNNSIKFSTYLYQSVVFCFINEGKKFTRQQKVALEGAGEYADFMATNTVSVDPDTTTVFKDSLSHLSDDGRVVVKTIFEAPEELTTLSKAAIGRLFKKRGWTSDRIERVFIEIRGKVCES